jgi:outer membrane lipoprotein-sorting protein
MRVKTMLGWIALALSANVLADVPRATTIPNQDIAKEVLRRYLEFGDRISVTAIVVRRSSTIGPEAVRIKVEQDAKGRSKATVLGPVSQQGSIVVDDGRTWINYCPDTAHAIVQPSPRDDKFDPNLQLALAAQNYKLVVEKNVDVAGRLANVVVAIPKTPGLPTRRISVDAERNVLLRIEVLERSGARNVLYDTKSIRFVTEASAASFRFAPPVNVRVTKMPAPVAVKTPAQAKQLAGFTPLLPKKFQYGFTVREGNVITPQNLPRYVAYRITDGLITATLYQWRSSEKTAPLGPDFEGMDRTLNGVTMRLTGELPRAVRERILEGIANEFGKTFRPNGELPWRKPSLSPKREPKIEASLPVIATWI